MSRRTSLAGASALAITVALSLGAAAPASAACSVSTYLSGTCTDYTIDPASFADGAVSNLARISGSLDLPSGKTLGYLGNFSTIGTVTNNGNILTAAPTGFFAGLDNNGTIGVLANNGTIRAVSTGGTYAISNSGPGGSIGTITNSGLIAGIGSGHTAIINNSTIGTISNSGTIIGGDNAIKTGTGSGIGTITNSGTISGDNNGIDNGGTIGALTNSGTISGGSSVGIVSTGSIGTLRNQSAGTIIGGNNGVYNNGGSVGTLSNDGIINSDFAGIDNEGTIGTLTNGGTISANTFGVTNFGYTIGVLSNGDNGTISGNQAGIISDGTIGALTNSGIISGGESGIEIEGGSIGTLTNGGTISGGENGIHIDGGVIGALTNEGTILAGTGGDGRGIAVTSNGVVTNGIVNTGTILSSSGHGIEVDHGTVGAAASGNAIDNSGLIKGVTGFPDSSGIRLADAVINGNIVNQSTGTLWGSAHGLNVNAGSTITGNVTNSGTIYGGSDGVHLDGGTINGNFANSGTISGTEGINNNGSIGTLTNNGAISGANLGVLNLSDIGTLTNSGTISGTANSGIMNTGTIGTLTNGAIISGGFYGITNTDTIGALTNSGTVSGGFSGFRNTGSVDTLSNSGTIGAPIAVENAPGGTLGRIRNSGVIAGTIVNDSSTGLVISGGDGAIFGTLTGAGGGIGTIRHNQSDLTFDAGNLFLNDHINASGHTVHNTGATLRLDNTITITGAYSQTGGGLISTATGNGASYGHLVVDGNASVSNAIITVSGAGLTAGQTFTIVDATGTGSYSGDTARVAVTNGLGATVSTVDNDLVVTLVGGAAGSSNTWTAKGSVTGGVAAPVGAALDNIRTSTSSTAVAFQNDVLGALDALPVTSQGAAIKQLAPSQGAPTQMSTAASNAVLGAVEQHQQTAMAYESETGVAAGSETHDTAIWGQFLGGGARRGSNAEADGYRLMDFGLATGIDHRFTPNVLGGAAVSWLRAWTQGSDNSSASSSTLDSYQLTLYGTYRLNQAFVDGQLGFGWNEFDQERGIAFLGSTASAKYSGQQYLAKATVGYDVPVSEVTVTPMASLRWLRSVTDAYDESGAGAANLSIDSQGVNSVTQDLGAKVAWSVPTALGALKPEVKLAWVHDYTKGPIATSGLMGGSAFAVTTPRTEADGVRIGLATTLSGDDDLSFRVEYEGELRAQYQSHTALVKALWGF